MQGILGGGLPPGLAGWVAADQMNMQKGMNQLGVTQGILGIQNMIRNQTLDDEDRQRKNQLIAELANSPEVANSPLLRALVQSGNAAAVLPYLMPKPRNPVVVAPGASLVDPSSPEKPLYTAPIAPKEQQPSELSRLIAERDKFPPGDPNRTLFEQKITKLTTHAPAARQTTIVNPMRETFKDEQALRNEFSDQSKSFIKLSEGYSKVKGALAADPTTSAPATLTAATQFMKMLDPESVVRESELGMALDAAGMWDRFTNIHNSIQNGKVLTPNQTREFGRIADVVFGAANTAHQNRVKHYRGLAESYNFNPDRVVPQLVPQAAQPAPAAPAVPGKIRKYNPATGRIE